MVPRSRYPTNVPPAFIWQDSDAVNTVVNQDHGVNGVGVQAICHYMRLDEQA